MENRIYIPKRHGAVVGWFFEKGVFLKIYKEIWRDHG
jgi:hypothetical protein